MSGDPALRNGIVSKVCDAAPADVKARFSVLVLTKRKQKDEETQKRKRAGALLKIKGAGASPFKQSKLRYRTSLPDADVDLAWGRAFFGLDIPVAKISMPLFREAMVATQQSKRTYVESTLLVLPCLFPPHKLPCFFLQIQRTGSPQVIWFHPGALV